MIRSTVLIVVGPRHRDPSATAAALRQIAAILDEEDFDVAWAASHDEARAMAQADAGLAAALVDWDLPGAADILRGLAERFRELPVFLLLEDAEPADLPLWVAEVTVGYLWPLEDTARFLAGRIVQEAREYEQRLVPPFLDALQRFDDSAQYSWHTPAHHGGIAFMKSPIGRRFFDYYGERLFRTDLSVSVGVLGSLFEHTGPVGAAERNAARIFGAETTYFVLHGTSTANRITISHSVVRDEIALLDRNCHKSICHGITLAGARPVYLVPTRNGLGLTGPIPPASLAASAVRAVIDASPLAAGAASPDPTYAVITNSTYDGLCYDVVRVAELLSASAPRLHLDEAWFAHARFHPLYTRRYAMAVDATTLPGPDRPTVLSTQSSHKLLAAFSQGAMMHVRGAPRAPVDHRRINETYMMHGTTSPLYPMIACLDVAAAMMDGSGGRWLIDDAVGEAIRFRRAVPGLARQISQAGDRPDWFFGIWQPETVTDPRTGESWPLLDAPFDLLRTEASCWELEPGASWHGFAGLESGYCLLDPLKVTITCPGARADGPMDGWGIPARILTAYLETREIVVEKTDTYSTLVLFSMGITRGKAGTLLNALTDFKHRHDGQAMLHEVLPGLVAAHPERYQGLTLPELCAQMHDHLRRAGLVDLQEQAFTTVPTAEVTPAECHRRLVRDDTELVRLDAMAGRVAATMVVTTPPGIPVLMPGENAGADDGPLLRYLRGLQDFDREFPGFASEIHGIIRQDGHYWIECLR